MVIMGGKRTVVPDTLPLAYSLYAFINVDNCERSLKAISNDTHQIHVTSLHHVTTVIFDTVVGLLVRQK